MTTADIGNFALSSLTVISQILFIVFLVVYTKERKNKSGKTFQFFAKNGLKFAFLISLFALFGSLFYSDILGYNPCKFCWYERIFMYPQVILLGLALWRKENFIIPYSLTFTILGALLALNHYILQLTGVSIFPCSAVGQSVTCNKLFVLKFGYITIPLMAFSAFALMTISLLFAKHKTIDGEKNSR